MECLLEPTVQSGVQQGSVVGHYFSFIVNDLSEHVSQGSCVRIFADDYILYRNIKTQKDTEILQNDLSALQQWEQHLLMEFHPNKYQVLHVTNKNKHVKSQYNVYRNLLEETDTAKYQGVNIHRNFTGSAPIAHHIDQYIGQTSIQYASVIWDTHTRQHP